MQTIFTKYLGATNTRGARIKATQVCAPNGRNVSVTIGYNYAKSAKENHTHAAKELALFLEWRGGFIGGDTRDGMVFVLASESNVFHVNMGAA